MNRTQFIAGSVVGMASLSTRALAAGMSDSHYSLPTVSGTLYGTLLVPDRFRAPGNVVLMLAGSGPTDRDGNSPMLQGKNDALLLLASALADRGIASLRIDKRGIGASAPGLTSEDSLRFDNYVDDAVAWVAKLRADARFRGVVVAGHSEGALIGTIAARRTPVRGLAVLSGAGRPASAILREQLKAQLDAATYARADAVLAQLDAGHTVSDVPAELSALFRASVQPYMISWLKYDPAVEFAAVSAPRGIVWGTADVQVSRADTDALKKAAPSAKLTIVSGMNHVLKHAPDTSSETAVMIGYTNPALPVEVPVIDAVAALC